MQNFHWTCEARCNNFVGPNISLLVTCGKMGHAYKSTEIYKVHNYCKGSKPTEKEAQVCTNSLKGDMRETCDNSGKTHTWEAYDS